MEMKLPTKPSRSIPVESLLPQSCSVQRNGAYAAEGHVDGRFTLLQLGCRFDQSFAETIRKATPEHSHAELNPALTHECTCALDDMRCR